MTLDIALHCIVCTLTPVAMQRDARIDLDSILAFLALCPCAWLQKKNWLQTDYFRVS